MRRRLPVRRLVEALVSGDESRSRAIARESLSAAKSRTDVFADLIQPAQYEIGELWYSGRIGVAIEHRATAIVEAVVEDLEPTPSAHPVRPGTSCVLAAVGDEQHVVGLRVLQLALEDDGWLVEMSKVRQRWPSRSHGRMRNSFCESYAGSSYSKRVV